MQPIECGQPRGRRARFRGLQPRIYFKISFIVKCDEYVNTCCDQNLCKLNTVNSFTHHVREVEDQHGKRWLGHDKQLHTDKRQHVPSGSLSMMVVPNDHPFQKPIKQIQWKIVYQNDENSWKKVI